MFFVAPWFSYLQVSAPVKLDNKKPLISNLTKHSNNIIDFMYEMLYLSVIENTWLSEICVLFSALNEVWEGIFNFQLLCIAF